MLGRRNRACVRQALTTLARKVVTTARLLWARATFSTHTENSHVARPGICHGAHHDQAHVGTGGPAPGDIEYGDNQRASFLWVFGLVFAMLVSALVLGAIPLVSNA